MSTLATRTIEALRLEHDDLARLVTSLGEEELAAPSGASDWSVAQVLSHLGSGAEINLAVLQAALGRREVPDDGFNPSVWDRWNALGPAEQRDEFVVHNTALLETLENLDDEQRSSLRIALAYLPAPITVATHAGMRLNEAALHGWDVRVARDPEAGLLESSAATMLDHLSTELGFLLGFVGKADQVDGPVVVALGDLGFSVSVTDTVALVADDVPTTATFTGPAEAVLRLIGGRLAPAHTPATVQVQGNVTLDDLRAVFPGY